MQHLVMSLFNSLVRRGAAVDAAEKTAWLCGFCHGAGKNPAKTTGYGMVDKGSVARQTRPIETRLVT